MTCVNSKGNPFILGSRSITSLAVNFRDSNHYKQMSSSKPPLKNTMSAQIIHTSYSQLAESANTLQTAVNHNIPFNVNPLITVSNILNNYTISFLRMDGSPFQHKRSYCALTEVRRIIQSRCIEKHKNNAGWSTGRGL